MNWHSSVSAFSRARESLVFTGAVVVSAMAVGLALPTGYEFAAIAIVAASAALLIALRDWRWSMYGLLLYLPISGLPIIALYPNTGPPNLFKDFLFVIPAYIGFVAWAATSRAPIAFPGAPVVPLGLLATLVALQALNPALPNQLVAAIGLKVWLLYIPLLFLGYHFVNSKRDVFAVLGVMSLGAIIPSIVGLVEAILIYGNQADRVYSWYGDAASAVTQSFTRLSIDPVAGITIRRIPSTFSFVGQYYAFLMSMVAITYAWWRGAGGGLIRSWRGGLWLLVVAAAFLCGARAAFIFAPMLILVMVVLERGIRGLVVGRLIAIFAIFLGAVTVIGSGGTTVVGAAAETGRVEFYDVFVDGFRSAADQTMLGLGTGVDSVASRYAVSDNDLFQATGGTWYESWYVKVFLELGVVGLILVGVSFAVILRRGFNVHRGLRDPQLRVVSAAILAFVVWLMFASIKGQTIDQDPVNVYFWLLIGVLFKLTILDVDSNGGSSNAEQRGGRFQDGSIRR